MVIKTEKIGKLSVWTEKNRQARFTKTVYFDYCPVVSFDPNKHKERRIAAVQLVELGYCKSRTAGKICGFHANTVARLLGTKRLLGIEALLKDDRGPKTPWKYVGKICETIKELLGEPRDWTDHQIAAEAAKQSLNTSLYVELYP